MILIVQRQRQPTQVVRDEFHTSISITHLASA